MQVDRIERELKFTLAGADDGERLAESLGAPVARLEQRNLYFDTAAQSLRAAQRMLRVRVVDGEALATLKTDAVLENGQLCCREREAPLRGEDWDAVCRNAITLDRIDTLPIVEALRDLGDPGPLQVLGETQNLRRVYRRSAGYVLELDRTTYPDGSVDAEIEVETEDPEPVRRDLVALLTELGISWSVEPRSKFERLLERWVDRAI